MASIWDELLNAPSPVCPGCRAHAPRWRWVRVDGLRVLTHDGDVICPRDRNFGYATGPEPSPTGEAVAA